MYIYQDQLISYLDTLFTNIKEGRTNNGFFIFEWPKYIGKTSYILDQVKILLWDYLYHDFLHIRDLSDEWLLLKESNSKMTWSHHALKVEAPKDEDIKLSDGSIYKDLWVREINDRLTTLPYGRHKVVFIENIERLNNAWANALLKTFEEPGDGVLIFATCSNKNKLLPTILSRWFLVHFPTINEDKLMFLLSQREDIWDMETHFLIKISMWRAGLLYRFVHDAHYKILYDFLKKLDLHDDNMITDLHIQFVEINKLGLLDIALEIITMIYKKDKHITDSIMQTIQYLWSNLNISNVLYNLLTQIRYRQ